MMKQRSATLCYNGTEYGHYIAKWFGTLVSKQIRPAVMTEESTLLRNGVRYHLAGYLGEKQLKITGV